MSKCETCLVDIESGVLKYYTKHHLYLTRILKIDSDHDSDSDEVFSDEDSYKNGISGRDSDSDSNMVSES